MKKIVIIVFTVFISFCYNINNVIANTVKNNWYLGSKIGWSQYDNLLGFSNTEKNDSKVNKLGSGLFIGYKENNILNFELGYDWLGLVSHKQKNLINLFQAQGIQLSAKIICPIYGSLDFYSRLGAIVTRIDVKKNNHTEYFYNATPLLSLGGEYKLNNSWSSRLEYQFTKEIGNNDIIGQETNNSMLVFGLSYLFNKHKSTEIIDKIFVKRLNNQRFHLKSKIFFKYDDFTLQNRSKMMLNQVVHKLKFIQYQNHYAYIIGYADFIGKKQYNLSLSKKRSDIVSKYLILQGIPEKHLYIQGLGSTKSENHTNCKKIKNYKLLKKCLASDRVVEIDITGYYAHLLKPFFTKK
ncbi:OmpA family protein [Enterobacteriaceae endosymbiont of Plateumaris consimilis]|uniref:OmpA family protein n=1 Tax=Enterobacteriaceae endosymbiont of Plateumaris consimilis TaxID=2675794 RepID=UPI00144A124E|nr:OmpA family protein [Enterobacteriaceae endosymbiont of Plateumaris consimilis]QJC28597.1 OmpA family protein [Enterobacteriaceae endosymbiont of Plateumaris consimilis]